MTDARTRAEPDYRRLLVTGGAGFIGSCYVRDVLARRDGTEITVLDKLTYAGNEANLAPVRADPEQAARLASSGVTSPTRAWSTTSCATSMRSSTSPPSRTSIDPSWTPRRSS